MIPIRITNWSKQIRAEEGVHEHYVGRIPWIGESSLASPFTNKRHGRGEALRLYRRWLDERLRDPLSDQSVEMDRLRRIHEAGPMALRCHCAPLPCHAEVIREILEGEA